MNLIKRTGMNKHKQSQKIVFGLAGITFLLMTTFPQTLWASGDDRVALSRFLEVLELVLGDRSGSAHGNSSREGYYYRGNDRYREYRPVVNKYYQDNQWSAYNDDHRKSKHYRRHPCRHHHPKHKRCNENRHWKQYYDDYSWKTR